MFINSVHNIKNEQNMIEEQRLDATMSRLRAIEKKSIFQCSLYCCMYDIDSDTILFVDKFLKKA